ncbi:Membrane associated serine protease, rhomboid family [Lachnospiraceae bacterium RM5]|nr:Membrane associated serine protease, rhomboid family [Lachnospiraceae bacterium RM5]
MKLLDKLERKYGKYAIKNLMLYIIILYVIGFMIAMYDSAIYNGNGIYHTYFSLNMEMILKHGQVWRLFTFIIQPPSTSPIFVFFTLYLYYILGINLERVWGAFKFNVYFFMGIIFQILAAFILYLATGYSFELSTYYLNMSLFLAFAMIYPNMELLLFFFIPIKIKYLALIDVAYLLFEIVICFLNGTIYGRAMAVSIIVSLLNFIIFTLFTYNFKKFSPSEVKRKNKFKSQVKKKVKSGSKCEICGRTSEEYPDLAFRYCSKCKGTHCYCEDHIFTHVHIE